MQITGGKDRGRKIKPVKNPAVRPSKAVVREALFSVLGPNCCYNKIVGDFFSGSGIMTLEALSRGAKTAFSVDSDPKSCSLIRDNFSHLQVQDNARLMQMSVAQAIVKFADLNVQFDIIFLDPPYDSPNIGVESIEQSVASGITHSDSVIIFEHRSTIDIPECHSLPIWKQKKYGQSMLTFYKSDLS